MPYKMLLFSTVHTAIASLFKVEGDVKKHTIPNQMPDVIPYKMLLQALFYLRGLKPEKLHQVLSVVCFISDPPLDLISAVLGVSQMRIS